jgi:uncharacterized protein
MDLLGLQSSSSFQKTVRGITMQQTNTRKSLSPVEIIGVGLSLIAPALYVMVIGPVFLKPNVDGLSYTLIGFGVLWILALGLVGWTLLMEKQSILTIGWQSLSWKQAVGAMAIGVLLSLLVPVFSFVVSFIVPASQTGSIDQVTSSFPWWVILLSVITAGITEEILFRGYPIERLLAGNINKWLSAGISLLFFVVLHAAGWNSAHLIGVVIPLGIALTGLYLWQRNLKFLMIVHVVIDLPLVFIALTT